MRISWREILGLLVGLGMCYALISYALVYAPQLREMAAEQKTQEDPRRGSTEQQNTTTASSSGEMKKVTVRVLGSSGESFGINYGNLRSSHTDEGTVPADFEVEVNTDPRSGDYISALAWKTTGDSKELKIQVLDKGKIVKEGSTTKDYGAAGARWSPGEKPPEETTASAGKTTGAGETTASVGKIGETSRPQP